MVGWSLEDWSLTDWSLTASNVGGGTPKFRMQRKPLFDDEEDEDMALILFALSR